MLVEKISEVLAELKTNQRIKNNAEFAMAAGMSGDRLKNILGGKVKKFTPKEMLALQSAYGIRVAWWSSDTAPMWLTEAEKALEPRLEDLRLVTSDVMELGLPEEETRTLQALLFAFKTKNRASLTELLQRKQTETNYVYVPRYDIQASAGGGSVIHDEAIVDHLAFRSDWVRQTLGLDPAHLALIDVRGDSMSPTIEGGDLLLLDTRLGTAKSEGVFVINLNGSLLVKRVRIKLSGVVEIVSDNPNYGSETISGDELDRLAIVGRVVWHGRKF